MTQESWFDEEFHLKFREQAEEIGRFNLAVFGKTGVGKSTLINEFFDQEVAATGVGKPVTMGSHLHRHDSGFFGLLDTRGLEIGSGGTDVLIKDLASYIESKRKEPQSEQIHVAWYCVRATDRRFEDAEADFIRRLDNLGLPVIVVLTQSQLYNGKLHPEVLELSDYITDLNLPIVGKRPIPVMAMDDNFLGLEAHGLQDLLEATFQVAPAGVEKALAAAQKVDLEKKSKVVHGVIAGAATAAGVAGGFKGSDVRLLTAIQLGMITAIAHIYRIDSEQALVAWTALGIATNKGSDKMVDKWLKSSPPSGKGIASGAIAAGLTSAVGYTWNKLCREFAQGNLSNLDEIIGNSQIRDLFLSEFETILSKERH